MAAAFQDYAVQATGDKRIYHNGAKCHQGRLVTMDANAPPTAALLKLGWISATLGGATQHDATHAGVALEAWTTYHVTASGAGRILHSTGNPPSLVPLAQGAAITLDPAEEPATIYLAKGWIS